MKKKISLLASLLFILCSFAQKQQYDIILFGNVIGKGDMNRTIQNGVEKIDLITNAKAKVMFKDKTNHTDMDIVMKNGLLESLNQIKIDDGEKQTIKVTKEDGKQFFYLDGKKSAVPKPVKYTTTHFFFKEPVGIKEAYVERMNIFVPIEKVDASTYKTTVDGADNFYTYKDGKLIEYKMKNFVNVYMKPIEG